MVSRSSSSRSTTRCTWRIGREMKITSIFRVCAYAGRSDRPPSSFTARCKSQPLRAAVVEETDNAKPEGWVGLYALQQHLAHVVVPGDDCRPDVAGSQHEAPNDLVDCDTHEDERDRRYQCPGQHDPARELLGGLGRIADGKEQRQQHEPAKDEADGDRPPSRQDRQRAEFRTLEYRGRENRNQDGENAQLAGQLRAIEIRKSEQHPDGQERRHQDLNQDELSDQDATLEDNGFVHRSPNAYFPCSARVRA